MPRGGFRPGSGAPKGNTNGLKKGTASERAQRLAIVFRTHPNIREVVRIGIILGIVDMKARTADLARAVEVFYPAVFDRNHPWYNQINQRPEAGYPKPWPGPSFEKEELRKI